MNGESTADPEQAEAPAIDPAQIAAFEAIVAANHDEMARVAFVISEAPGPAQDAVRSAWVRAWRALTSQAPPPQDHRRDWLLALAAVEARHLADTGYRARDDAPGAAGVAATQASAAPAYKSDELELANAMAALDGHDRIIVALRYVGGLDAEAIGRELGMPDRAVLARIPRIVKSLVGEERLASVPSQTVADAEGALAARIRGLTGRAVVPLDPAEVAKTAIETPPEAALPEQLETWLRKALEAVRRVDRRVWPAVAGAALFFIVVPDLVGSLRGGLGGFLGGGPVSTPVPNDAHRLCAPDEAKAVVADWQASGGDWIASVEVRNVASSACLLNNLPEPSLVDRAGNALLQGQNRSSNTVRIGPGDVLRTSVEVHNYCGPAPALPVTIAFRDGSMLLVAAVAGGSTSGVPACAGGGAGSITMQPWAP